MRQKLRLLLLLLIAAMLSALGLPVYAQADIVSIDIAQVDNSNYPSVTLYVRVFDSTGKVTPNLTQDMFHVTEDGTPVDIVSFSPFNQGAITTALVLDISGSMNESGKLQGATEAARTFIELMRSQDQAALITFENTVSVSVALTSKKQLLVNQIDLLEANGGTACYDAVIKASDLLQNTTGRRSIILLTDGLDNQSTSTLDDVIVKMQDVEVPIYSIGLGGNSFWSNEIDEVGLQRLADETGGTYYLSPSPDELSQIYRQISSSTQEEYVITYHSPRPNYDGTKRNIIVSVGTTGGQGDYVEVHLLNIQSDFMIGLLMLSLLLLMLFIPLAGQITANLFIKRKSFASRLEIPMSLPVLTCSSCGRELKASSRFCANCGATVKKSFVCANCGHSLRPNVKFCPKCGLNL